MHASMSGLARRGELVSRGPLLDSQGRARRRTMPRPVHFELSAEDPDRLSTFYGKVFGWTFKKWGEGGMDYRLVTTGEDGEPGINGGVMARQQGMGPGTVNTMGVESVDKAVET